MPDLKQRLKVEFENIEKSLAELPTLKPCTEFSKIELAGVSALLHNFYNGIEKILKDILNFKDVDLPSGGSWHRDLVNLSVEKEIITQETAQQLNSYLAFRHFFVHAYVVDLEAKQLEPLVKEVRAVYENFKNDLSKFSFYPGDLFPKAE